MMIDISEELRIIAKDRKPLDQHDCAVIMRAAEIVTQLEATQAALIESQAARIALNDRLLQLGNQNHQQAITPLSAQLTISGYQTWK